MIYDTISKVRLGGIKDGLLLFILWKSNGFCAFSPSPALKVTSPYDFLSEEQYALYNTAAPFSITLTTYLPNTDTPYHMSLFSSNFYLYVELDDKEFKSRVASCSLHQHNTYELIYVREGEFYQQIEASRYKYIPRSCCLLNRNVRHREEYTTGFSTINLSLSANFLEEIMNEERNSQLTFHERASRGIGDLELFFSEELDDSGLQKRYINFTPTITQLENNDIIHDLLDELAQIIIAPMPGSIFHFKGDVCKLVYCLSDTKRYSTKPISLGTKAKDYIFSEITKCMERTHGRISRKVLEEKLNYSGSYLNRVVKKYTGMSIFLYGNTFTMQRAAWLLTHSDMTVSQIATELGFTDRTHFYRLFQNQFGKTPKQYRTENRPHK